MLFFSQMTLLVLKRCGILTFKDSVRDGKMNLIDITILVITDFPYLYLLCETWKDLFIIFFSTEVIVRELP